MLLMMIRMLVMGIKKLIIMMMIKVIFDADVDKEKAN